MVQRSHDNETQFLVLAENKYRRATHYISCSWALMFIVAPYFLVSLWFAATPTWIDATIGSETPQRNATNATLFTPLSRPIDARLMGFRCSLHSHEAILLVGPSLERSERWVQFVRSSLLDVSWKVHDDATQAYLAGWLESEPPKPQAALLWFLLAMPALGLATVIPGLMLMCAWSRMPLNDQSHVTGRKFMFCAGSSLLILNAILNAAAVIAFWASGLRSLYCFPWEITNEAHKWHGECGYGAAFDGFCLATALTVLYSLLFMAAMSPCHAPNPLLGVMWTSISRRSERGQSMLSIDEQHRIMRALFPAEHPSAQAVAPPPPPRTRRRSHHEAPRLHHQDSSDSEAGEENGRLLPAVESDGSASS